MYEAVVKLLDSSARSEEVEETIKLSTGGHAPGGPPSPFPLPHVPFLTLARRNRCEPVDLEPDMVASHAEHVLVSVRTDGTAPSSPRRAR
jgi:hypothetical protein